MRCMVNVKILHAVFTHACTVLADSVAINHVAKGCNNACNVLIGLFGKSTTCLTDINRSTNYKLAILLA